MGTQVPTIERPNYVAIAGMPSGDIFRVREYHLARLVAARRKGDSDTTKACIDWIVALTSEMRLRGSGSMRAQKKAG